MAARTAAAMSRGNGGVLNQMPQNLAVPHHGSMIEPDCRRSCRELASDGRSRPSQVTALGCGGRGEPASVQLSSDDGNCVVWLCGEVDLAVSEQVAEVGKLAVRSPGTRDVVIDLGGLTFLDLTGVAALLNVRAAALDAARVSPCATCPSSCSGCAD